MFSGKRPSECAKKNDGLPKKAAVSVGLPLKSSQGSGITPTRTKNRSSASLAVAVTVVVVPTVFGTKLTVGPPPGPLPLAYQSERFGDHS